MRWSEALAVFGWISLKEYPPPGWDLRRCGWTLCAERRSGPGGLPARLQCRHVLLIDAACLAQSERLRLSRADRPALRLIMLGVEEPAARAQLIAAGCAEALSGHVILRELDVRARRIAAMLQWLPRWRGAGPLVLDLFHRDGRLDRRWLGLHPREFGLLWRLAESPGTRVTRTQLLHDVWRLDRDPETNSLEVHVSRLRAKLARLGCATLVETVAQGGYRISMVAGNCAPAFANAEPGRSANVRGARAANSAAFGPVGAEADLGN